MPPENVDTLVMWMASPQCNDLIEPMLDMPPEKFETLEIRIPLPLKLRRPVIVPLLKTPPAKLVTDKI